jgi:hypothetical protein
MQSIQIFVPWQSQGTGNGLKLLIYGDFHPIGGTEGRRRSSIIKKKIVYKTA